jgi:peptidyl-prolyl cis-trans isomerase SurA
MKKLISLLITTILLLPLSTPALSAGVPADAREIDRIVAIVEDEVITRRQLLQEIQRIRDEFKLQGRQLPPAENIAPQVLELLINQSILLQQAKQRGVTISDSQLNRALEKLAANNRMSLGQFRRALIENGIDYRKFRDKIRREMMINTIKRSFARQNVEISDQEVDDYLRRTADQNENREYRLAHILVALPDGASSEQVGKARRLAEELVERARNGEDFGELARRHSASGTALEGGDLGWRKHAEIPSLFSDLVPTMKPGQVSDPIRAAGGFHIVRLVDLRDADQVLVEQTHARHILIKPDTVTTDKDARRQLEELRQQLQQGADFAELARQYSDDPGSKGLGGDLGWVGKGVMVPEFEQVMLATPEGEVSEVFRSPFGWHILQVLERRTVDETDESKRKKIRALLHKQKRDEVLELWQRRLRDEAFVKILDDPA